MSPSTLEAARQYRSIGRLRADLLRPDVYRAWERCHLQGADPQRAKAESVSNPEQVVHDHSDLVEAAAPYMALLSHAAREHRHAAMLGGPDAVVLDVQGDPETVRVVPAAGALLDEASAGANGIGTPLAELAYAELIGREHFIEGFAPFTCQGVPIYGPDGTAAAVISTSMQNPSASRVIRSTLVCASHGIAAELQSRALARVVEMLRGDDHLLEQLRQDIVQNLTVGRIGLHHAVAARDRAEHTGMIEAASSALQEFKARGELWLSLAGSGSGEAVLTDTAELVSSLTTLLATEAAIRRVTLKAIVEEGRQVSLDRGALLRSLLELVIRGFDAARCGGEVHVRLFSSSIVVVAWPISGAPTALPPVRLDADHSRR